MVHGNNIMHPEKKSPKFAILKTFRYPHLLFPQSFSGLQIQLFLLKKQSSILKSPKNETFFSDF